MFDRVLAEVLERHGAALTPACRADLTAALRAAGVAAPEASTDKLQLLDLAGQTFPPGCFRVLHLEPQLLVERHHLPNLHIPIVFLYEGVKFPVDTWLFV